MSLKSIALTAGAAGAAATVWGVAIEPVLFAVRRHRVDVLPPGAKPIRVLHVSDLHMAPWQRYKQRWVASLTRLNPDLIINTGDNLGHPDALRGVRRAFDAFAGVPGVFVHGSHDSEAPTLHNPFRYFAGPSRPPRQHGTLDTVSMDEYFTAELGWRNLTNTVVTDTVVGMPMTFLGLDDPHRQWDQCDAVAAAYQRVSEKAAVTIGVTHAPYQRVLDFFADSGADLMCAGHTHGGQVRVPLMRRALVSNCDLPLDQVRGLSTWKTPHAQAALNVSAGVGHSVYSPIRFACRPEVSLLTLVPRGEHDSPEAVLPR